MAEEQFRMPRDFLKDIAPWTKLFSAFKIALDPKKLVLAACGLLVMATGWYALSVAYFSLNSTRPTWDSKQYPESASDDPAKRETAWKQFKRDRQRWYLLYELAGTPPVVEREIPDEKAPNGKKTIQEVRWVQADLADFVNNPDEFEKLEKAKVDKSGPFKPYGRFRVMPWFEDRGPNPYLLVTGGIDSMSQPKTAGVGREGIVNWFVTEQLPVLLEPLVKFFMPILYLFDPAAGFWNHVYLFLIMLWSLATWAFFGGAITRIAVVQVARPNERISLNDAVSFVKSRYKSYFTSPLLPMIFLFAMAFALVVFGLLEAYTFVVGDIFLTLLWPIVLLIGLIMAVVLVGLVGWPLMYATISSEGSDSFDAISRSYSYVYQSPWSYLWYSFVALVYGAVLVFFIGFMGSLVVYMGKWAVTLPPTPASREPSYLFQYSPTSFGWRNLLLYKSPNAELRRELSPRGHEQLVNHAKLDEKYEMNWHNRIGAFFVSIWLYLLFLLVVGFGYSYFWTASTIIYLLMRRKVDDTEMDEIHWEEEIEQPFPQAGPSAATEAPKASQSTLQMVDPPQIRGAGSAPSNPSAGGGEPTKDIPRSDGPTPPGGMH